MMGKAAIHLRCLVLDGIYRRSAGESVFQDVRARPSSYGDYWQNHHAHGEVLILLASWQVDRPMAASKNGE